MKRISHKQKMSIDKPFTTAGVTRSKTTEQRREASEATAQKLKARSAAQKAAGLDAD